MIRVAIFDDHKERREALRMLLDSEDDLSCAGAYENCSDLVRQLYRQPADVVLMDIDMPQINGIEGVRLLHRHFPAVWVIMQTVFEDDKKIFDSIRAGAHGYILKKAPPERLIDGIREVVNGGSPMTATIARRVMETFREQGSSGNDNSFDLSEREVEVLSLLVKGLSQKMIASQLSISPFTVANHIKKIYQKLHVHNASEAVSVALLKRLI